ncbi:hypothetical protein DFQ28_004214 [Apophysomyces sp. BC1034]|nr:hypothetical protein DFQ29_003325 [Apophysomyces sp. BC1021]KAG0188872.1 hypothetical protein DFQ28_004214 [Apophysomyces sp. BC1034]
MVAGFCAACDFRRKDVLGSRRESWTIGRATAARFGTAAAANAADAETVAVPSAFTSMHGG